MEFNFLYKNKKINLDVEICKGFRKFSGLMFVRRKNAKALLFEFKNSGKISLHSFFVFFSFLVIWMDEKNNLIEKRIVKPFRFCIKPHSKKKFSKILEIPINKRYKKLIKSLS